MIARSRFQVSIEGSSLLLSARVALEATLQLAVLNKGKGTGGPGSARFCLIPVLTRLTECRKLCAMTIEWRIAPNRWRIKWMIRSLYDKSPFSPYFLSEARSQDAAMEQPLSFIRLPSCRSGKGESASRPAVLRRGLACGLFTKMGAAPLRSAHIVESKLKTTTNHDYPKSKERRIQRQLRQPAGRPRKTRSGS